MRPNRELAQNKLGLSQDQAEPKEKCIDYSGKLFTAEKQATRSRHVEKNTKPSKSCLIPVRYNSQ